MASANLIFERLFPGAGYPAFAVEWPGFDFPTGTTVNKSGWARPVVDGYGKGIPSRAIGGVTWRARADTMPGRSAYRASLWASWKNPGYAGQREVGLIVRYLDVNNCLVARIRSMVGASPELRLFKVVAGTATQLGSTYTGLTAAAMAGGVEWSVRCEDLADGTTRVVVYTGTATASSKGTSRIDYTGDLSALYGAHGVGIELNDQVYPDDVAVDNLRVYDLADEWNPTGGYGSSSGWTYVFGNTAYSIDDLNALAAPIAPGKVKQAYGMKGNTFSFRVLGDWRLNATIVKPGLAVKVLHNGVVRFDGVVATGNLTAGPQAEQSWQCFDAQWAARQVVLGEDDLTGTLNFNVFDEESDDYDPDRQDMTVGDILAFLFDRYTDGASNSLRFYGAAPATGDAYTQSELDALDAVPPDVSLSGNLQSAIETLITTYMPTFMVWVDPTDRSWHFRDVTDLDDEAVVLTNEWATLDITPDRDQNYTAVLWRGAKKANADQVVMNLSASDPTLRLTPAWSNATENAWIKDKRHRTSISGAISSSGTGTYLGVSRPYIDISASFDMAEDDWKGAIVTLTATDTFPRLCVGNTATRLWLSAPAWSGSPAGGVGFLVNLADPDAVAALSMQGVGRAYYAPAISSVCGYPSAYGAGLKNRGFCGYAQVKGVGDDGAGYVQNVMFQAQALTQAQQDALGCDVLVVLAEPPKIPIGLVNRIPPPGGSPPTTACETGATNQFTQASQVDIEIAVSQHEEDAPYVRVPTTDGTFEGDAYTDWDCRQVYVVDDADFVDASQAAGLTIAAQSVLDLKKNKAFMWSVRLATPWNGAAPDYPTPATTARFAGLSKRITLSASGVTTGFESTARLPVLSVTWDIQGNTTELQAGTVSAFLSPTAQNVKAAIIAKNAAKRAAKLIKQVEDFRNKALGKPADRVGGIQAGPTDGCDVLFVNDNMKRVADGKQDDEQKWEAANHGHLAAEATRSLLTGIQTTLPGYMPSAPGLDGDAAQQSVDGGPVLRSWATPWIPGQGPVSGKNGNRGRYGGLISTDDATRGSPPAEVYRGGGIVIRKKAPAGGGGTGGGVGLEWATLGPTGATGGWTTYTGPGSLTGGVVPRSVATPGSLVRQAFDETAALAAAVGALRGDVDELLAPGDVSTDYPDGAPADLWQQVAAGLAGNPFMRVIPSTRNDPGGTVYAGPQTLNGAQAGLYWRCDPYTGLAIRVENVGLGSGTNDGAWSAASTGVGSTVEYATALYCVHKQIHAKDLSSAAVDSNGDPMEAASPPAAGDDPFCLVGQEGRVVSGTDVSGAGGRISLPPGCRGTPMLTVHMAEDPSAVETTGHVLKMSFGYSYRGSPWTAAGTTAVGTALTADGSGTGTGFYAAPGGAVPTGLRKPSDLVVVAQTVPGSGTFTGNAIVGGIDVDVAVVDGGYLATIHAGVGAASAMTHNRPAASAASNVASALTLAIKESFSVGVGVRSSCTGELDRPLVSWAGVGVDGDATVPAMGESMTAGAGVSVLVSTLLV